MKMFLSTMCISGILVWFCYAQESGTIRPGVSDNASPGIPNADPAAYYASLNQRVLEFKTRLELLSQLAQEHKKRAQETPRDQVAKNQWENELAKELGDRAAAIRVTLNRISQERLAFEQAHPDLVASALGNFPFRATKGPNPDEIAFLDKVEERLAALQQEIAETVEAGKLYTSQLLTNKSSFDVSRVSSLLQANGSEVKKLQKEVFDLELRRLEFRALRGH